MATLTKGRLKKIVRAYRQVIKVEHRNHAARLKVARALRLLGRTEDAVAEYGHLAHLLARDGDLLGAISACKSILDLDPSHRATQETLARLYAMTPQTAESRIAQPLATPVAGPDTGEHGPVSFVELDVSEIEFVGSVASLAKVDSVQIAEATTSEAIPVADGPESLPAIEFTDLDFEELDAEPDSAELVPTHELRDR